MGDFKVVLFNRSSIRGVELHGMPCKTLWSLEVQSLIRS